MSQSVAALSSSARVVIIGVRDYDKPWAQTAEGALHDAIAWWHYAVGRLGVHPQNIRLLTSPRLGALDLVEAVARPDDALRDDLLALARATPRAQATGANISASVDWLMAWRGQKLLTFSGHGVAAEALLSGANAAQADLSQFLFAGADHVRATPKEYASYFSGDGLIELVGATPLHRLAPGASKPGAAGDGPEQAPPPTGDSPAQGGRFDEAGAPVISRALPRWAGELRAEIGERLGGLAAGIPGAPAPTIDPELRGDALWVDDLTVVIDACFATPVAADATIADRVDGALAKAIGAAGRGLLSCDVNHTCYTADLNGRPQGAWSWALQTVLSRWQTQDTGLGQVFATITHDELHLRARALLDALGLDQRPLVAGPREVDQSCLLGPIADEGLRTSALAALAPDVQAKANQQLPIPKHPRWEIEIGSAASSGGAITWSKVGYLFNPEVDVLANGVLYKAGTEHWRTDPVAWAAAQTVWNDQSRYNQRLRMRLMGSLDENSVALANWLQNTFQPYGLKFTTPVATSYGAGAAQPQIVGTGFSMLCGTNVGGGLINRGLQIVFGTGNTASTMASQGWFWRAPSAPNPADPSNSGYFTGPATVAAGELVLTKLTSFVSAQLPQRWYTHVSSPS